MILRSLASVLFVALVAPLFAAERPASAEPFKDGEVVCFVGDSITHRAGYHSLITLFYATRFPDRRITTINCGIDGDRASAIMSDEGYRLEIDVLGHHPTVATIMLGMNDINRGSYGVGKTGPADEAAKSKFFEIYRDSMTRLIETLEARGTQVILIEPSIYDETAELPASKSAFSVGANAALGRAAEMLQGWSLKYRTGLVDFYDEMNAVNAREQKKEPHFTVVSNDRIHPGPAGSFVMAYAFFKAQHLPREVSDVAIDGRTGRVEAQDNASVSDVAVGEAVAFTSAEKALPFVVPAESKPALAWVPFQSEFNQETITVHGLPAPTYRLTIDSAVVGSYTAEQLDHGIDLAENEATPQYAQSAEATRINLERARVEVKYRYVVNEYYVLSKAKVEVGNRAAVRAAIDDRVQKLKADGKPIDGHLKDFLAYLEAPGELEKQLAQLTAQLTEACRPKPHRYVLTPQR